MKNRLLCLGLFMFASLSIISYPAYAQYDGFQKDPESEIYYRFYTENKEAARPQSGDLINFIYTFRSEDSVFIRSIPMQDIIQTPFYKGDIYTAFNMMHLGDSATFILNGDSFFYYFLGREFDFEKKELYVDIKLTEISPREEHTKLHALQMESYSKFLDSLKLEEMNLLAAYVKDNRIKTQPNPSGLYYISKKKGTGKKAEENKYVSVHYTWKNLNGTVLATSKDAPPLQFKLGTGMVIPGFEEGVLSMREGGKATLIIPSSLAYGEKGVGQAILPYTPMLFQVELLKVGDNEE